MVLSAQGVQSPAARASFPQNSPVSVVDFSAVELLPTEMVNVPGSTSHCMSMFQNASASGTSYTKTDISLS
jgi:hypothetical protein